MSRGKAAWSAALQSRYTEVAGVRLHDRGAGRGAPIVFVHGLAVSSTYFIPTIRALAPWYSCRAVDLPGFGRSDDPGTILDIAGLADALAGWLDVTGQHGCVLVGNSAGCQIVVDCAARHAEKVGPLVLIGPTTDAAARSAPHQVGRWLRSGLHGDIAQVPMLVRDAASAGLRRVGRTFGSMLDDEIEAKLPRVAQPTLVVRGSRDPIAPQRWAAQVADALPHGRLEVVAGGAHVVHYTFPQATGLLIRQFLDDIGWP